MNKQHVINRYDVFIHINMNESWNFYVKWSKQNSKGTYCMIPLYIISRWEAESRLEFMCCLMEGGMGNYSSFLVIYFWSDKKNLETVVMAVHHCKSNQCIKMIAFVVYVFYYINCF